MKTVKILVVAVLALVSTSAFGQKYAIIETSAVMQKMIERDSVQSKLEETQKRINAEYQAMVEEFNKKVQEYQNQASTLSKPMAQQKEKELSNLQQSIESYQVAAQQEINAKQAELLQPITEKINAEIEKIGKSGGYTFVFSKDVPLYFNEATVTDITQTVLKNLGF